MKNLVWLIGGTLLAMGVLAVLDIPYPVFAESGTVNRWGNKQRMYGAGGQLKGKLKQGIGNVVGNQKLASQGTYDEVAGTVRSAVGKAASSVGNGVRSILN